MLQKELRDVPYRERRHYCYRVTRVYVCVYTVGMQVCVCTYIRVCVCVCVCVGGEVFARLQTEGESWLSCTLTCSSLITGLYAPISH